MREDGEALHAPSPPSAQTLAAYASACLDAGADGIFFATVDWATYDIATNEQYDEFGRPYDLPVLSAVAGGGVQRPPRLPIATTCSIRCSTIRFDVFNWAAEQDRQPQPGGHPDEDANAPSWAASP